jgi:inorganic triphosphatase YgiF
MDPSLTTVEVEIKLAVPEASRAAVEAAVATRTAQRTRLQAVYFDTADRRLAQAGVALRLRREGSRWVQTLKAASDDALVRLEHNVELAGARRPPLDPQRHAGTPAGDRLAVLLAEVGLAGADASALVEQYRTDIVRCHRVLRVPGGAVEIAFDSGHLIAGRSRLAVCELEFEMLQGDVAGLIGVASRWALRHRLWLDVRTKAERGDLLARGETVSPPTRASAADLDRRMRPDAAARAVVRTCLAQVLPNASAVAAGVQADEHVHQLRVGLRRLRTALRLCEGWDAAAYDAWQSDLSTLFRRLGAARDQAALKSGLVPALSSAGAPWVEMFPRDAADAFDDPAAMMREPGTTRLMLELQGYASGAGQAWAAEAGSAEAEPGPPLRARAMAWLNAAFKQIRRDAGRFATLADEDRHRLRRRTKRLRYAIEFVAPLFDRKAVRRFIRPLAQAQDDLGRYNDLVVGLERMRNQVEVDSRAWFAVGWISARRDACAVDCAASLKRLRRAEVFWSGR